MCGQVWVQYFGGPMHGQVLPVPNLCEPPGPPETVSVVIGVGWAATTILYHRSLSQLNVGPTWVYSVDLESLADV